MPDPHPSPKGVATVSELTDRIRRLLEPEFSEVLVEGELSNINRSRNGHYYFTAKDSNAQIPCVVWNRTAERLKLDLRDGQQVILGGALQIYPPHGKYQLIVDRVEQAGIGRLQLAFEKLKAKLKEEGLFDPAVKKELPPFPLKIGVITSSTGAAFHDITSTLEKRWPMASLVLYHASVQGAHATAELVEGIRFLSGLEDLDLLIIGRGGGSLEDLWPFNEEAVARALFACPLPVISAVGHEVDFSISDFVADLRAATPTQAALLATPDINDVRLMIDDLANRTASKMQEKLYRHRQRVEQLGRAHALLVVKEKINNSHSRLKHLTGILRMRPEQWIPAKEERIRTLHKQMEYRCERILSGKKEMLTDRTHRLAKQNPNEPLEKGFVRVWQQDRWIRKPAEMQKEHTFELEWREKRISF